MKRFRGAALALVALASLLAPVASRAECDDVAPPTAGIVRDGNTPGVQRYDTVGPSTVSATWTDFADDCGITGYQVLVSTVQGDTGVPLADWIPAPASGGTGSARLSDLPLDASEVFTDWSTVAGDILKRGLGGGWQQVASAARDDTGEVLFIGPQGMVIRYDGRSWTDLGPRISAAMPGNPVPNWQGIGWNGEYWLLVGSVPAGANPIPAMVRVSADFATTTDLSPLVTPMVNDRALISPAWNSRDGYWLIVGQDGIRTSDPTTCVWRGYAITYDGQSVRELGSIWPATLCAGWIGGGTFAVAYNTDDNSFLIGGGTPHCPPLCPLTAFGIRLAYAKSEWIMTGSRKFEFLGTNPHRGSLPWGNTICVSCLAWDRETKHWILGSWSGLLGAATEEQASKAAVGNFADLTPRLAGWDPADRARASEENTGLPIGEWLDVSHIARMPDGSWLVGGGQEGSRFEPEAYVRGTALNRFRTTDLAGPTPFEDLRDRLVGWDQSTTDLIEVAPRTFAVQPLTFIVGADVPAGKVRVNVIGQRTYYVGVRAVDAAGHVGPIAWSPGQRLAA